MADSLDGGSFELVWTGSFIGVAFLGTGSGRTLRSNINSVPITTVDPNTGRPYPFNNADGHIEPGFDSGQSIESYAPTRILRHIRSVFQAVRNDEMRNTGSGNFLDTSAVDAVTGQRIHVIAGHFYIFDKVVTMWDITYLVAGRSDGEGRPPIRPGVNIGARGGIGRVVDILLGTPQDCHLMAVPSPPPNPTANQGQFPAPNLWIAAPWLNAAQLTSMITNSRNQSADSYIPILLQSVQRSGPGTTQNRNQQSLIYLNSRWGWLQNIYLPEGERIMRLFGNWQRNQTTQNQIAYLQEMVKTGPINNNPAYMAFIPMLSGRSLTDLNGRKLLYAYNLLTPMLSPIVSPANPNQGINGRMVILNR